MKKSLLALAVLAFFSTVTRADADGFEDEVVFGAAYARAAGNTAHGGEARTAHRANGVRVAPRNGVFQLLDGTCIQRTVHDHGYTRVTIDAQGTLNPMKNDIVEDVTIACP